LAQSNVYSLNVVGYVNKVLKGGNYYTSAANPLNTTNNTLAGLFGGPTTGLITGTRVLKWSTTAADFVTYTKTSFGTGWSGGGESVSLNPGEGCLILTTATSGDITNTFVGEVLQGNLTNSYIPGYQMTANQVPDSGSVTALGLTTPTPVTSRLLKWNNTVGAQGDWEVFTRTGFGVFWSPSVPNLDVAEGILILAQAAPPATGAFNWVRNFTVP